ncbi:MAG: molybdopterin molybdotransferase MoeA [Xanthomonadales bacterium]|nr:molybdopterin molybdotransferase MoeA [Xanthomonadales bacterium]
MTDNFPLISITQAEVLIRDALSALPAVRVPLAQAAGRVLQQEVLAERDQPPFDRVMMDGIAVDSTAASAGLNQFRLAGTQSAGDIPLVLPDNHSCIEIMTGAVLPTGCDAVIPIERISISGNQATLEEDLQLAPGQHIHPQGSDYRQAARLLEAGVLIRAPELAVLASSGITEVLVSPVLSAGVISPGNELIQPGEAIKAHQIRRSNDLAVAAALESRGDLNAVRYPAADDRDKVAAQVKTVLAENDCLIICGAVSKGKYDFVPAVLAECGVKKIFHRVAQRPGKPFWFGISANGKPVFALPGNPVSVLACTARYVVPALDVLRAAKNLTAYQLPLSTAIEAKTALGWLLAVHITVSGDGELTAVPQPTNTSGDFAGLSGADGIVELPAAQQYFPVGYRAAFYPWGGAV